MKYLTLRSFLKDLIAIRDQPLSFLKGYDKLTEEEVMILGYITGDIANAIGEDEFQELLLLKKFIIKSRAGFSVHLKHERYNCNWF